MCIAFNIAHWSKIDDFIVSMHFIHRWKGTKFLYNYLCHFKKPNTLFLPSKVKKAGKLPEIKVFPQESFEKTFSRHN